MKLRHIIISALALMIVATVSCGKKGNSKKVTVALNATYPPMEMLDKDKNIIGFDVDYFKAVGKEVGIEFEFINVAWDGIFAGLAAGKYDMIASAVTITDDRKKTMDFTLPYFETGLALVVPKDSTAKKISDLKGQKAGSQIGTTGAFQIKKHKGVILKNYDAIGLAFEDMASGRIAAVVCDTPVAADYALQKAEYKKKFKIAQTIPSKEFFGAALPKGKDKALLEKLNKGIKAVQSKGIDKKLMKKWLGIE